MEQNQDQEYIEREHCLILEHRRSLKITGVTDVIAYDEHIIQINTTDKALEIRGDGLHMKQLALDKGIIEVEGCVNSLEYQEQKARVRGIILEEAAKVIGGVAGELVFLCGHFC